MYFPESGVEIFPLVPVAVAFAISFVCSMGGLSGAFLLLPFQMSFLHFTSPAVSPTNHLYNVISTPSGVWRFIREQRMVWPLTAVVVAGTVPGTLAGSFIRLTLLPDPHIFKIFVAAVLLYIGVTMGLTVVRGKTRPKTKHVPQGGPGRESGSLVASPAGSQTISHTVSQPAPQATPLPENGFFNVQMQEFSTRHIRYTFMGETYGAPTKGVFLLCFLVGIVGGAYGIGGGAIIAPFLVSVFRLPIHTIAGTTLLGNFLTSLSGLLFFLVLSPFFSGEVVQPDWALGGLFGLGGLLGIYCGARAQRHVPELYIKIMLTIILAGTAVKYVLEALG